ncbi:hypothetical protein FNF31_00932 [Cafeteria roenbergensis]|uniref:THO complex subunit 2 n=1 Tax=Cafeteria roenbergensis TaxID=33653 RepID=A0A5A8DPX4_CAFRO|nr:hypothetical protein FNF31_00932 [Cafeteria roenbergensis]
MAAWDAMEQLPWHRRFRLFTWWHDGVYGLGPASPTPRAEIAAAAAGPEGAAAAAGSSLVAMGAALPGEAMARLAAGRTSRMARHVLKRVAKDTAASATKALGRLIAAAPLPALSAMVVQLERFSNLVELSMDALRFATPLAVSALVFLLVGRMAADVPGEGTVAEFDDALAKRASARLPPLGREVYKEGEVMTAGWLANLASTAAWAVRRLPGADPSPLLVLVCRRLAAGAMGHLPLLHQLLELAGGIGSPGNATDDQTAAVGASTALQEALGYASVSTAKDGVVRLRRAIKQGWGAGPAALPLWVAVAQATEAAAFCEAARSANMIKAAAQLHDSAADALTQVTDLIHGGGHAAGVQRALDADLAVLREAQTRAGSAPGARVVVPASVRDGASVACLIPPAQAAALPSLSDLVGRFGLSPAAAFRLLRPWIRGASMPKLPSGGGGAAVDIAGASGNGSSSSSSGGGGGASSSGDGAASGALVLGMDGHTVRPSRWAATGTELELEVASLAAVPAGVFPSSGGAAEGRASSGGESASSSSAPAKAAGAAAPAAAAAAGSGGGDGTEGKDGAAAAGPGQLSPLLYSLFWSLDLFDLHCPRELYGKGEAAVKEAATEAQLKSEEEATPGETARAKAERERKLAAARKQAAATVRQLRRDLPEHSEHVARVRATLATLAPWFGAAVVPASAAIANKEDPEAAPHLEWAMAEPALARHCLLPRAAISPADALYAARFLRLMHEIEVPRLSTMRCLNASLFGAARRLLSSTEAEAGHLGIFLSEVMGWVSGWRDDREAFNTDAACRRGMLKAYMRPSKPKPDDASAETVKTSFALFTKLCGRWDETITDTLCDLLASEEPMRRKAALLLTKRLSGVSPRAPEDLAMLHEAISGLASSEQPKDIQVLALSTATDVLHRLKALGCAADGTPVEGGVSVTNAGAAIYAEAGSAAGAPDSRAGPAGGYGRRPAASPPAADGQDAGSYRRFNAPEPRPPAARGRSASVARDASASMGRAAEWGPQHQQGGSSYSHRPEGSPREGSQGPSQPQMAQRGGSHRSGGPPSVSVTVRPHGGDRERDGRQARDGGGAGAGAGGGPAARWGTSGGRDQRGDGARRGGAEPDRWGSSAGPPATVRVQAPSGAQGGAPAAAASAAAAESDRRGGAEGLRAIKRPRGDSDAGASGDATPASETGSRGRGNRQRRRRR